MILIFIILSVCAFLAWHFNRKWIWAPPPVMIKKPMFGFDYGLDSQTAIDIARQICPEAFTPDTSTPVSGVTIERPIVNGAVVNGAIINGLNNNGVNNETSTLALPVHFNIGEPTTFDEYAGQDHILGYLRDAVAGLDPTEQALEPQIFLGPAGMGKTLLAKVVANELRLRAERLGLPFGEFIEVFPADFQDLASLDAVMRRVVEHPGSVVFIDEAHDLVGPLSRKLYLPLNEFPQCRYLFTGEPHPTLLPPVTFLAATTDYGSMHPALQRRWFPHNLRPATPEQLVGYMMNRPFPIEEAAAQLIVERTKFSGAPWEGLQIRAMAVTAAKAAGADVVAEAHVQRVFDQQEIDELGLRCLDRDVITVLFRQPRYRGKNHDFVCFAASESDTCQLANIDRAQYRDSVKPRLMARQLLQVRPGYGQALTERAGELYGYLKAA